jgi:hypothetical protein
MAQTLAEAKAAAAAATAKAAAAKAIAAKSTQLATLTSKVAKKVGTGAAATTAAASQAKATTLQEQAAAAILQQATADAQYATALKEEENAPDAATLAKDKIVADTLASYGLAGIAATVGKIRAAYPKISSDDLLFILKNDPAYNSEYLTRFAGNAALKKAGKPTLSDAEYLQAETEFGKIFTAYGATSLANQQYYATLIGNSMDAVDVTDRMNQAYAKIKANPEVKSAFNKYYETVTDGDILAAVLDPTTQLPILQKKVTAAEIGGAALTQKLETSKVRAEELAGYGVTGLAAETGYSTIAKKLPRGKFLTQISPEEGINYNQVLAEDIQFKKNAEAQRQEDVLIGKEIGRFGGSSGRLASKERAQGAF